MLYGTITEFCTPSTVCSRPRSPHAVALPPARSRTSRHLDLTPLPCALVGVLLCGRSARSCQPAQSKPPLSTVRSGDADAALFHVRFEFLFEDGSRFKKPTALSAPEYVDALMTWIQGLLDDEEVFPSRIGELAAVPVLPYRWQDNKTDSPCLSTRQALLSRRTSERRARLFFADSSESMATFTPLTLTRSARSELRVRCLLSDAPPCCR